MGPFPNALTTAWWVNMQRFLAFAIIARETTKGPSSVKPRMRSEGSKSENQRGGIIHVSERICGTLSSITSLLIAIASSILGGIKNFTTGAGSVSLNEPRAAQHRAAVDQGQTYLLPSSSMMWAPSRASAGGSLTIILRSALYCSS